MEEDYVPFVEERRFIRMVQYRPVLLVAILTVCLAYRRNGVALNRILVHGLTKQGNGWKTTRSVCVLCDKDRKSVGEGVIGLNAIPVIWLHTDDSESTPLHKLSNITSFSPPQCTQKQT